MYVRARMGEMRDKRTLGAWAEEPVAIIGIGVESVAE